MYWVAKGSDDLSVYVWNRVKSIQETGITIYYTSSSTNPADLASKVKPLSSFINNKF